MKRIQRELRWNVISEEHPTEHTVYLLIINDNRGIKRIVQRAREELAPTEDLQTLTKGSIRRSGLGYKLLTLKSYIVSLDNIDWAKIYKRTVTRDRDLVDRKTIDGLANYVDAQMVKLS